MTFQLASSSVERFVFLSLSFLLSFCALCWSTVAVGQEEVEISSKQTGWRPRQEVVASWCGHYHLELLSFAGPESLFCQGIWTDQIL